MNVKEWYKSGEFTKVNELKIFNKRAGTGETLVCIHGFPSSSWDFEKIWSKLTARFDVITFDLIGLGKSAKPDRALSISLQADMIEDIKQAKSGYSYIVVTKNDGMTYKRVENLIEEKSCFLLKPDNPSYQSYQVPISEVLELWKFTCSINTQEYEEHELKISSIINMFQNLGVELASLNKLSR